MAGLATGSVYFGRQADRHTRPLVVYAWLELGVGVYAALTPWLFPALQSVYTASADVANIGAPAGHIARFAIALLALLLPTFLMGGTLPLLILGLTPGLPALGRTTGRLYGINTLGAVSGTLLAGFVLLPAVGVSLTIYFGVAINLAIAAFVFALLRSPNRDQGVQQPSVSVTDAVPIKNPLPTPARIVIPLVFATAGFAALLTQLAWIRALILVVGGSVYAFTITLASFLTGIGLGSLLYTRFVAATGQKPHVTLLQKRLTQAALLAALTALALLLGLPLFARFPAWFMAAYSAGLKDSFPLFQLFIFVLSLGVMVLPTLLMGALFPLVTVIWTTSMERAGKGVGTAYALNTAGTILGALLGGVAILPWLGVQGSVMAAAGLYALVAAGFWLLSNAAPRPGRYATAVGVAGVLSVTAWLIPPWDRVVMTSGVFHQPGGIEQVMQQQPRRTLAQVLDDHELLYFEEGADATVAVRRARGNPDNQRTLLINGKADASSITDMPTQVLLAQLPLAIHPGAESALVIGLGSGISAGSLAKSETLRDLTVLEISAQVVEASDFFAEENYRVLDDPRVRLATADARNYLMASRQQYDVIVSEPSNPWISGVANLFTDEFLQLAKSRLRPGGVMTQWFHAYSMDNADLKTMLKTFDRNFDFVSVWQMGVGDLALIGSDEPHALSLSYTTIISAEELARAGIRSQRDLAGLYVLGGETLSNYVREARVNSDERPVVEFNAPRYLYAVTERENMQDIVAYLRNEQQDVPLRDLVMPADDGLSAPFMSLAVAASGNEATQVRASWVVDRAGRQSQRLLTWREEETDYRVRAVFHDESPRVPSLEELLELLQQRTGRQGGRTALADGTAAIWLLGTADDSADAQLDMAWDCAPGTAAASRHALTARLPVSRQDDRQGLAERISSRIRCVPTN
jgi:spermidine synthase